MCGQNQQSDGLFSYADLEARVPKVHPLCLIQGIVDDTLGEMSSDFEAAWFHTGGPGIGQGNYFGLFFCRLSI